MLIVSASFPEMAPVISLLNATKIQQYSHTTALYHGTGHDLLISGIGPPMVERTLAYYLREHHPAYLVNIGGAGVLAPDIELKQAFCIRNCIEADTLKNLPLHRPGNLKTAVCASSDHPILNMNERDELFLKSGAELVDMECYTLAGIAEKNGIRMSSIKVTTDFADRHTGRNFKEHLEKAMSAATAMLVELIKII